MFFWTALRLFNKAENCIVGHYKCKTQNRLSQKLGGKLNRFSHFGLHLSIRRDQDCYFKWVNHAKLQSTRKVTDLISPDTGSWSSQWSHPERWWFPSPWVPDTSRPVTYQGTERGWWWWSLLHRVPTKQRLNWRTCSSTLNVHLSLCTISLRLASS